MFLHYFYFIVCFKIFLGCETLLGNIAFYGKHYICVLCCARILV